MKIPSSFFLATTLITCNASYSTGKSANADDATGPTKGGVALIYEIEDTNQRIDNHLLVDAIKRRLNGIGLGDVRVRPYGDKSVQIVTPPLIAAQLAQLKAAVERPGRLSFRILANKVDHKHLIELAKAQPDVARWVVAGESRIGLWADVACSDAEDGGGLKVDVSQAVIRDPKTKAILTPPADVHDQESLTKWLREKGFVAKERRPRIQVLMWTADGYNVDGSHIAKVEKVPDQLGNPSLAFSMTPKGSRLMGGFTGDNLPEDNMHSRRLGILFDYELLTAPTLRGHITVNGEITGNFTDEEIDFLVNILRAGSLPAVLKSPPVSEIQAESGESPE